jgi:predicted helicase
MSKVLINKYYADLEKAIRISGSLNEDTLKNYFWMLLNEYAHKQNYEVIREAYCQGTGGKKVKPDGLIKTSFRLDIGLWEAKDEKDHIDEEIDAKKRKGYPFYNILFTDDKTAILFQRNQEVKRVNMKDPDALDSILTLFLTYKSEIITKFEVAIENFKKDVPHIVKALRDQIITTGETKPEYLKARDQYLALCQAEINPDITLEDVREMMIQHVLTSDLFNKVFDDPDFHRHNTIAHELEKLIDLLFTYGERRNLLGQIEHYYEAINSAAANVGDHHEKQKFLKVLYEVFYKVYNPKAADRLGVVYTPNEIVQFMIESTDYLLEKHFGKTLADKDVEILDPATGTGTFITSIIDHIPAKDLAYKYKNEIHANEVAILPYYISNLNIEYTFKQKMGYYEEFPNLCFVDTLDNTAALKYLGQQQSFSFITSENTERIARQNSKKISVIIGNPPYNANQKNENENNKNREYPAIDKRIKETYIKHSTAQKTKVYDMYARFYRWASDRIDQNGILCFITNNSFVNSRTFDGFRKSIQEEFDYAYIIDLGGNIRELSGRDGIWLNEEHTIFGVSAAVGISIMLLVKKQKEENLPCLIYYIHPCDIRATRINKLEYLKSFSFEKILFTKITPDKNHNWINLAENDWDELIGLKKIFELTCNSIKTNRDEWVYDFDKTILTEKIMFLIRKYSEQLNSNKNTDNELDYTIKWSSGLKDKLKGNQQYHLKKNCF